MENTLKRQSLNEELFIFAFIVLVIRNILIATQLIHMPDYVDKVLVILFIVSIGCKLLLQSYTKLKLVVFILFALLFLYTSIKISYNILFYSYLFVIALQDVDLIKLIKRSAWTKLVILSIHISVYIFNYIVSPENIVFYYRNGIKRHNFFLGHPNLLTTYLVWTTLELIYVYYTHLKRRHIFLLWTINFVFYKFTNSNTGIIVLTGIILIIFLEKSGWKYIQTVLSFLSKYIFIIFSIMFPIIAVVYTKLSGSLLMYWNWIDDKLTGRLMYGAYAYDIYGFTFLGKFIDFPSKSYWRGYWFDQIIFDNSYLWLFIINGSVYLIIISVALFIIAKRTSNIEKIMIIALVFYGVMEAYLISVNTCFPLLIVGKYIYESKKAIEQKACSKKEALWVQRSVS